MLLIIISFICLIMIAIFTPSLIISIMSIVIAQQNSNITCGDSFMTLQTWLYTSASISLIICGGMPNVYNEKWTITYYYNK